MLLIHLTWLETFKLGSLENSIKTNNFIKSNVNFMLSFS